MTFKNFATAAALLVWGLAVPAAMLDRDITKSEGPAVHGKHDYSLPTIWTASGDCWDPVWSGNVLTFTCTTGGTEGCTFTVGGDNYYSECGGSLRVVIDIASATLTVWD